ncbi:ATP-dependent DNA ligase [Mesorhizobium japonicum]|uniref:Msl9575 protein n=1 Tax=Mesorhizobium japonicum (strain LMG 29417 / CECT 9101 / MAFF 303099) TaxID=266835 RepID=Q98P82_RHILO|nr:ATP-dependent DNA ligase [Mesorhizobium japonicum]BAB54773.1 msl9575 [Mesorhizobium japonicum MAFF 303099]
MVSKRRNSKYRSGPSTNWLKAKCCSVDECELLGVEHEAGKPASALMADRATGRYVGSAFINPARLSASGCGSGSRSMPDRRPKA